MNPVLSFWVRVRTRNGQTMGEYALVMAGIAIVAYLAYQFLGSQISTAATAIGASI